MLRLAKDLAKKLPGVRELGRFVRRRFFPTADELLRRLVDYSAGQSDRLWFVKVGANDGVTHDPFDTAFLRSTVWHGVLIEPVPYCVKRLEAIYADEQRFTIEPVAISPTPGTTTFYYVAEEAKAANPDLPPWYDQLGSFDREHIVKHLGGGLEPWIVEHEVRTERLDAVLQRCELLSIDVLHIDTEGADLNVLKTIDLGVFRPRCIMVEHKHLSDDDRKELVAILHDGGYQVGRNETDLIAMRPGARGEVGDRRWFESLFNDKFYASIPTA